jgi:aldehyde:ferredoxin oxidoreductase
VETSALGRFAGFGQTGYGILRGNPASADVLRSPATGRSGEVFNLKRRHNTRLGVSRKDDFLPPRFLTLKRTGAGLTNQLPPLGELLSDYYAHRRWTEDGIPSPEKLAELGLDRI